MLQSLAEFNRQRKEARFKESQPKPNGIECPDCGEELMDSTPRYIYDSFPPQMAVSCPTCYFRGYRVA